LIPADFVSRPVVKRPFVGAPEYTNFADGLPEPVSEDKPLELAPGYGLLGLAVPFERVADAGLVGSRAGDTSGVEPARPEGTLGLVSGGVTAEAVVLASLLLPETAMLLDWLGSGLLEAVEAVWAVFVDSGLATCRAARLPTFSNQFKFFIEVVISCLTEVICRRHLDLITELCSYRGELV
jgi:hypothetical protein